MNFTAVQAGEEAEYMRAKTSVWWDIENCPVPKGCDAQGIALKLSSTLMKTNYRGPLSISAYGNTNQIPNSVQHALASTGIALNHVPSGKKNASDKKILVDMLLWVVENPAPANIMLISGDGDFSDALHLLRLRRYNILLAHPHQASPLLVASATTTWLWGSLFPLTRCESSSRLVDNESYPSDLDITSQGVSEQVLSNQSMGSESNTSRTAGSKLKQNLELLGERENIMARPSECHEKDVIEKLEEVMPKQGLEMVSGEPENGLAGPSEYLEENMNMEKKKKKRKKSRVIEDKTEAYVCSICNVIFDHPTVFEIHINGRKHKRAAMIKKNTEVLLDDKQIEEEIIQDNGHSKEMIEEEIRSQPGEAHEYIECLEKQNKELGENENNPLPNEECIFTELNPELSAPEEAREGVDGIIKKLELSQDPILTRELESKANQNLELSSGDPESNTGGVTEHPEEYFDKKKKKDKATKEAYVCSICSLICNCPIDFESHLMGRKHAKRVKKHEEALVDVKSIEESVQHNDLQSRDSQDSMKCFEEQNKELVETSTTSEANGRELRQVFKELRECFDAILKKVEPSINEIVIEKLEEGLEMVSGEPKNALGGASEHLEENMNEKKKRKRKRTRKRADKTNCSDICDCPTVIQDNSHSKEMIEEIQFQPGEAREFIEHLEKQTKGLGVNKNKPLPNEDCIFAELNPEFSVPQEAREGVDAIIKKLEPSQDATSTQELKSIAKQNPEMNSGDPEEYMDEVNKEVYVCSICNLFCHSLVNFESHLMGRKHAARIKKHEEVLFDDKKTLEQSLVEKDRPIDAVRELQFQVQNSSIKEVCQVTKEGLENESEAAEPKEARERLDSIVKRIELSVEEDISKQSLIEGKRKKNGAAATEFRVCSWCNVMCSNQVHFDSHLAGKKHAAGAKKQVAVVNISKLQPNSLQSGS